MGTLGPRYLKILLPTEAESRVVEMVGEEAWHFKKAVRQGHGFRRSNWRFPISSLCVESAPPPQSHPKLQ